MRGLARAQDARYATAREMAEALAAVLPRASALEVCAWLDARTSNTVARHAARVAEIERTPFEGATSVRSRWRAALSLALGALVLAAAVVVVAARASQVPPLTARPALGSLQLPAISPPPLDPPFALASVAAPSSAAPNPTTAAPTARKPQGARALPRPSCRVPYVLGDDGLKHYKPECLE